MKRIKVLIVDDSALVREILKHGLSKDPMIEVVGVANDPYQARDRIVKLKPHVMTLDVEMPRMDGVEFLRKLMPQYPLPTVMVSSLTERGKRITIDALDAGAVDFVTKPKADIAGGLLSTMVELIEKIKVAARANVAFWKNKKPVSKPTPIVATKALDESTHKIIAIGASTGGTEAIKQVVASLPSVSPGVVIVQHMPPVFTKMFAEKLDSISEMSCKEAEDGDNVIPGRILVAPGDYHMELVRYGGTYKVKINKNEKVNGHRPSVDVLFDSVATHAGKNALGVILTGMGNDGAKGLLKMREAGAQTIGQNESTAVVYGMPKVANELGACEHVLPLDKITSKVTKILGLT